MSLFESIKPLIQICQFLGLAPFSMNSTTLKWEQNVSLKVFSIIFIVGNGTVLVCGLILNDSVVNHKDMKMRVILMNIFIISCQTHAMFALVEFYLNCDKQVKLLNTFEQLDLLMKQQLNMHIDYVKLKRTCHRIILVWICEICALLSTDLFSYQQTKNKYNLIYIFIFIPSYILSKLSYAYIMMLVSLVHENIDVLNSYLILVTKQNGYYVCEHRSDLKQKKRKFSNTSKVNLNLEKLLFIKNTYCEIWQAAIKVQNIIYWSFPIGCTKDFYVLLFNSYWLSISIFINSIPITSYAIITILVAGDMGDLLFLAHNFNKAAEIVS